MAPLISPTSGIRTQVQLGGSKIEILVLGSSISGGNLHLRGRLLVFKCEWLVIHRFITNFLSNDLNFYCSGVVPILMRFRSF
jgi:hypothetical protein